MEFFEQQYGVEFIDIVTDRRVLDLIDEQAQKIRQKHVCGTCKFAAMGDGKYTCIDDIVCVNADSPMASDFVSVDSGCEQWMRSDGELPR